MSRPFGPAIARVVMAGVTAGFGVGCTAATTIGPSYSPGPSSSVQPTASVLPTAPAPATPGIPAVAACADVFDATSGSVAMTVGRFGSSYGIATVKADGSDFLQIVEPGPTRDQPHNGTEAPRWTADGRILFGSNRAGGPDDWHVFVVDDDGGDPLQLTRGKDGIESMPMLSADGSTLVYAKALSTPNGPAPFGGGGIFASDADGSNERPVALVPKGVTPEFPEGAADEWPDISPDGQRVVFNRSFTDEGGLFVVNLDGTGLRRLVDADLQAEHPRWSPDGRSIVFHSNTRRFQTESSNVWVIGADGSGLRQLTHESVPGQAWAPDWSADGEHIVFVDTPRSGPGGLDVIGLDGTLTCHLWQGTGTDAGWDPDWGLRLRRSHESAHDVVWPAHAVKL